jgi:hypothetical protein
MTSEVLELLSKPRVDLVGLAEEDTELIAAIYRTLPEASEHVGYEIFDERWIKMYGRPILRAIGRLKDVQSWTWAESASVGAFIDAVSNDLLSYLGLPPTSTLAVVALTILLLKGISKEFQDREQK